MKISEILVENEYEKGKSFATKLLSPSQWIKPDPTGEYEKNKAVGSKLLSPSQWFKSDKSATADVDEKSKEKSTPTVNLDSVKHILTSVSRGEPRYATDIKVISQLRSKVKDGSISVSVDSQELTSALKSVINNDQLSTDQIKIIKAYADSI
jgi:hypothetical protein